jgi:hypothetical protein
MEMSQSLPYIELAAGIAQSDSPPAHSLTRAQSSGHSFSP